MEYSQSFFQGIIENMISGFAYHKVIKDSDGKPCDYVYLNVNKSFEENTGLKCENIVGRRITEILPNIIDEKFNWIEFYGNIAFGGKSVTFEQYSEVLQRWYLVNVYSPQFGYFVTIFTDITRTKKREIELINKNEELNQLYEEISASNEELSSLYEEIAASEETLREQLNIIQTNKKKLELSEERYKTLVNNSDSIIYSCDRKGIFTAVNDKFLKVCKLSSEDVIGKEFKDILKNHDIISLWNDHFVKVIENGESISFEFEHEIDKYKTYYNVSFSPIFDYNKKVIGLTGINHDITKLKKSEELITHMAYYDALTNLPNRISITNRLEISMKNALKKAKKLVTIFIDLDDFKRINDTLGHKSGDEVLIEVSKRLQTCIKDNDFVGRLSGDEFLVMVQNICSRDEAVPIINRIIEKLQKPICIANTSVCMTASLGVAVFPDDGKLPGDLMKSSDTAMYNAKEHGKNNYVFFNINMNEELVRKVKIEQMLRNAVKNDELLLFYQPQFIACGGTLRGFEALIRWNNPEMGFLNPMDFIPIAEKTGLITYIGEWVLNTACKTCKKVIDKYGVDLVMAVNISPIQLRQNNFYDIVMEALNVSELEPYNLELEVTESVFIEDFDGVLKALNNLKQYGVKIALDDFGTGYSSLSYLKKLPINLLKIDKSFINEVDLTGSIISLVHKLNIETIAEGVEKKEQMEYLMEAKCDNFQGFYLGKPKPEAEIYKIMDEYKPKSNT